MKGKKKIDLEEMLSAGVHFGHRTSKWCPKNKPFIFGSRRNVHIIDLSKTKEKLEEARGFIKKLASQQKKILLVGTRQEVAGPIQEAAEAMDMPFVKERWLGGTFTNFKVIRQRVERLQELEEKQTKGVLDKYTKKEQHEFQKEIDRLEKKFGGLRKLEELPAAVLVVGADDDSLSLKEAEETGVTTMALVDTNVNPGRVDYVIPANDDAVQSVNLILKYLIYAFQKGKKQVKAKEEKK